MPFSRRTFLASAGAIATGALAGMTFGELPATQPTMLTRRIPSSGQAIPAIGMGTWQTFDERPDDAEAMDRLSAVMKAFHGAGGRVIDSSPMYGKSEEMTGAVSNKLGINADLFVATKVWTRGRQAGIDQMNGSIGKLGRKNIELMQIHNLLDWQTHLATLRDWKAAGRFRYIGITHYQRGAFDDLERLLKTEELDFIQLPYSVDFRDAEERLLPAARDAGTAVLVMRPFGGGDLFTKVRGKASPEPVRAYADSWAQAFLKFLLADERVTAVLPATSKPAHMQDNVRAGFGPLPDAAQRKHLIAAL